MIDATKGLPSFSEMYTAYKNQGSLADTVNAASTGYSEGAEVKRKRQETVADAAHKKAQEKLFGQQGAEHEAKTGLLNAQAGAIGKTTLPIDVAVANGLITPEAGEQYKRSGVSEVPIKESVSMKNANTDEDRAKSQAALAQALESYRTAQTDIDRQRLATDQARNAQNAASDAANRDVRGASAVIMSKPAAPGIGDTLIGKGVRSLGIGPEQTDFERDQAAKAEAQKRLIGETLAPAASPAPAPASQPQSDPLIEALNSQDQGIQDFPSIDAAAAAGKRPGDVVRINGVEGTLK